MPMGGGLPKGYVPFSGRKAWGEITSIIQSWILQDATHHSFKSRLGGTNQPITFSEVTYTDGGPNITPSQYRMAIKMLAKRGYVDVVGGTDNQGLPRFVLRADRGIDNIRREAFFFQAKWDKKQRGKGKR